MLTFAIEPVETSWDEMLELARAHWHETMQWQHGKQALAPSKERYLSYDKAGWFFQFTARDPLAREHMKMVGYAGMYILPSMHTQQLIATEDTIFLLPEYRHGRNALRFFQYVEQECAARGAREISATTKPGTGAGRILEHLGFTLVNYQYSKHLPAPEACGDTASVTNQEAI